MYAPSLNLLSALNLNIFEQPPKLLFFNSPFIAKGNVVSNDNYKRDVIYLNKNHQICTNFDCPGFNTDITNNWRKLKKGLTRRMYLLYENYNKPDQLVFYHTADYSNGSSGGGIFNEKGELLGIISVRESIGSRRSTKFGIGHAYKINKICDQSKVLSSLKQCKRI